MPSKAFDLPHKGFTGLNTRVEPHRLPAEAAQLAHQVDTLTQSIAGAKGVGVPVAQVAVGSKFIKRLSNGSWISSTEKRYAMADSDRVYFTQENAVPQVKTPTTQFQMGIDPPTALISAPEWDAATAYAIDDLAMYNSVRYQALLANTNKRPDQNPNEWRAATYFSPTGNLERGYYMYQLTAGTSDGLESNPGVNIRANTDSVSATDPYFGKFVIGFQWPADTRITKIRVWRTEVLAFPSNWDGSQYQRDQLKFQAESSVFYLLQEITDRNIKSFTDNGDISSANLATKDQLTWDEGGSSQNDLYVEDHSPAPVLAMLSDRIHATAAGQQAAGSGVVFMVIKSALNNELAYAMNGFPQYVPLKNRVALDHPIKAVVNHGIVTVVFATAGTYVVRGTNDDNFNTERSEAAYFIRDDAGRSARRTSKGTIFLANEGLAVFSGARAELVSQDKLDPSFWKPLKVVDSASHGDVYYLFHETGTIVVDLRDGWQAARFSTSDMTVQAVSTEDDGIYVVLVNDNGNIRKIGDGEALAWKWQTPDFLGDNVSAIKEATLVHLDYEGDLVIHAVCDGNPDDPPYTLAKGTDNTKTTLQSIAGSPIVVPGEYSLDLKIG